MKRLSALILVMLITAMSVVAGEVQKFVTPVGQFTTLIVKNNLNVVYCNNPDSVGYAQFTAPAEYASCIIYGIKKTSLSIEVATEFVDKKNLPTVYIYSNFLQKASNEGTGTLKIADIAPSPTVTLRVIGNGTLVADNVSANDIKLALDTGKGRIIVSGECSYAKINLTGTGSIDASRLKVIDSNITLTGTGEIRCNVSNKLKVGGMGPGKVYYTGAPTIIKVSGIKGKGTVLPAENKTAPANPEEKSTEGEPSDK